MTEDVSSGGIDAQLGEECEIHSFPVSYVDRIYSLNDFIVRVLMSCMNVQMLTQLMVLLDVLVGLCFMSQV